AREVLHQHARRHEGDLVVRDLRRIPARQPLDFFASHRAPVLAAQQVLEQDLEGIGEATDREAALFERVQREYVETAAVPGAPGPRAETVRRRHSTAFTSTTNYSA